MKTGLFPLLVPLVLPLLTSAAASQETLEAHRLSVREIGDVGADGVTDLAIGKPWQDVRRADEGAVWVVHRQLNCGFGESRRITTGESGLELELRPGDRFGAAVAPLGDLNGDGVLDLAVGVPGYDGGGWRDSGAVVVLFLDASGAVLDEQQISATSGAFGHLLHEGAGLGAGLVSLGDLDGDLLPELGVAFASDAFGEAGVVLSLGVDGRVRWSQGIPVEGSEEAGSLAARFHEAFDADGAPLDVATPSMVGDLVNLTGSDPMADFTSDVMSGGRPLTVNFQDLSTGTNLSAWSWDFGDQHGSLLQNPTHPFYLIDVFDVSLTVAGDLGTDTALKDNFIRTSGFSGAIRVNGNDVNPEIYESITAPDFGTMWETRINGTAIGGTGLTIIFSFADWLEPTLTQFGELLVNVESSLYVNSFATIDDSLGYAVHFIAVPADVTVFGLGVFTQGFVNNLGNGNAGFTNALYVVLNDPTGG